jgi:cytochrome c-type biogenesis protein CcmH/NrfF
MTRTPTRLRSALGVASAAPSRAGARTLAAALLALAAVAAPCTVVSLALPAALAAQAANERPVQGAGPEERHPEADRAIDQLKSPYCPGLMLEVCPSLGGQSLRDSLQTLAEDGWSSNQLVEWVVANHGEEYRALPKRSGASLLMAWVIPPLAVLLGLGLVVVVLRRMRAQRPASQPARAALSTEDEERLRAAMQELDAEEEATFF